MRSLFRYSRWIPIYDVLLANFKGQRKAGNDESLKSSKLAYDWTAENIGKTDPYRFEEDGRNSRGKIMMTGNDAGALGSRFLAASMWWHGIQLRPRPVLSTALSAIRHLRQNENKENTIAIVQAEDELAAAGIVVGAGWAGSRALNFDQRTRNQS